MGPNTRAHKPNNARYIIRNPDSKTSLTTYHRSVTIDRYNQLNKMDMAAVDNVLPTNMYVHNCIETHLQNIIGITLTYQEQPMNNPCPANERSNILNRIRAIFQNGKALRAIKTLDGESLGSRYRHTDGTDYINIVPLPARTLTVILTFEDKDRFMEMRCPFSIITQRTVVEREVNWHPKHERIVKVR